MAPKKGDKLRTAFESFIIVRQIGQGGTGRVFEVKDSQGRSMAAKLLDRRNATAQRLKRFKNEIGFCSSSVHPNVVRVIDSGVSRDDETLYIMPLYKETLRDLISSGIQPARALAVFAKILDGVEAAHLKSVWHRDLKPENILFSEVTDEIVVADFGIAHFEEEDLLTAVETKDNERLANFVYSAPEQRSRGGKVSDRTDVFALALILNELFTGTVPQGSGFRRIAQVAPDFAYLDPIVDQMRHQDPSHRPSIHAIKQELIARGNEFIAAQRLNTLKTQVIREGEVDDPFISSPIRITSVDFSNGLLVFNLSAGPPANWIMEFRNPKKTFSFYSRAEPGTFDFQGPKMLVRLPAGARPAQVAGYAKSYVEMANDQYRESATRTHRKRLLEERQAIKKRVAEEEKRLQILAEIREIEL